MNTVKTHFENPYNDFAYLTVIWELDILKGIPGMVVSDKYERECQHNLNISSVNHEPHPLSLSWKSNNGAGAK